MKILSNLVVPTGNILIVDGDKGKLELLSIGDYGKDVNIKCDALGLTREIEHVKHAAMLPLEDKWVITISTQYGCSMNCTFCDVPKVGPGKNATHDDLVNQVLVGLSLHPEVKYTNRLNIHYARMGEPTWNPNVLSATRWLKKNIDSQFKIHPVVSTMMPRKNAQLHSFISEWMLIKNYLLNGEAGLQLSINSTSEVERFIMFNGNASSLETISDIMNHVERPIGRKITLNFAVAGYEIDPDVLLKHFSPDHYIIKLTPMHLTDEATKNNLKTSGDATSYHSYRYAEENLKRAGYDVLVFIASEDEDRSRITCGNAILSGTFPLTDYIKIL